MFWFCFVCFAYRAPLEFPDDLELSQGFKDFVSKALIKNPYKRITLDEALRHPWVQGKMQKIFN